MTLPEDVNIDVATFRDAISHKYTITWGKDVFKDAPHECSAPNFGTVGINFRARS